MAKYCMLCGASLPDNAKFCPECGEKLLEAGKGKNIVQLGVLVIRRSASVVMHSIPADIYIDEAKIGSVYNASDQQFRLPVGKHSVKIMIRNEYIGTRYIEIAENKKVEIVFAANDVLRLSNESIPINKHEKNNNEEKIEKPDPYSSPGYNCSDGKSRKHTPENVSRRSSTRNNRENTSARKWKIISLLLFVFIVAVVVWMVRNNVIDLSKIQKILSDIYTGIKEGKLNPINTRKLGIE